MLKKNIIRLPFGGRIIVSGDWSTLLVDVIAAFALRHLAGVGVY